MGNVLMHREKTERGAAGNAAGEGGIEYLFREYHALVFRAAWRITGRVADAEDVLQTVFLRLVRRGADAGPVADAERFLRRAAVNAALDVLRARRVAREVPAESVAPLAAGSGGSPERAFSSGEIREWLRAALARLNPRAAEIFALRFFEGKENPEIAAAVGTTPGTVAVTLHRARQRLLDEFREWMGERHEA